VARESRFKAKETNKQTAEGIKKTGIVRVGMGTFDKKKENRHSRSRIRKVRKK
jgi:hypothetical protein